MPRTAVWSLRGVFTWRQERCGQSWPARCPGPGRHPRRGARDRRRTAGAPGSAGGAGRVVDHEDPAAVAALVAALDGDQDAVRWAGTIVGARQLADAYGVTDTDGSNPDCWGYLAEYGWEREDGAGIEDFR
jgi:hypothetical protein